MNEPNSMPTSLSLLARLKDCSDQESWRQFFETYWRLIHATAVKAGLSQADAEEVVQEVMIAAAKKMPEFTYQPGQDSFKGWLLAMTRWKVGDQFRKRECNVGIPTAASPGTKAAGNEDSARTATVNRVPDASQFDMLWDGEWREHLLRVALDRIKVRVNPAHYEIYHLHVVQGMSVRETARALETNAAAVHLAKHRVGKLLKGELKHLQAVERERRRRSA